MLSVLKKIPLFEGMRDEDLQTLAARAETRSLPGDALVFTEGEPADWLYIILSGKVKVCLREHDKEVVLDTKGVGQYFGEMMLDETARTASVVALEPSHFAVISRADFKSLMLKHPEVAFQVTRNLIRVARTMNVKSREDARTHDKLRERIAELEATHAQDLPAVRRWLTAKRWVLGALLVFAVLQYYFIDVFLEVLSISGLTVFTGQ